MTDDFTPVRYDIFFASGTAEQKTHPEGRFVYYSDFLVARQSRDHWKGKASRWEAEAKSQETVIQNLDRLLHDAYAESDKLRAECVHLTATEKRLSSIIDLNTDETGRNLRQVTEENIRLRERLACLGEPVVGSLSLYTK
jgi:response regulator RpfG family c-di-GMP phosphodiesterase